MGRWAIHGTVHTVTDCQYCTNSYGCYLNCNHSTSVFKSSSILCATSIEFQANILSCKLLLKDGETVQYGRSEPIIIEIALETLRKGDVGLNAASRAYPL